MQRTWKERMIARKLRKLTSKEVTYSPEEQRISISKGKISINLSAIPALAVNEDNCSSGYIMRISGNPIVTEVSVVLAIWEALWDTPVFPKVEKTEETEQNEIETEKAKDIETEIADSDNICFKDVKPVASPNYVAMRIELVVPTINH